MCRVVVTMSATQTTPVRESDVASMMLEEARRLSAERRLEERREVHRSSVRLSGLQTLLRQSVSPHHQHGRMLPPWDPTPSKPRPDPSTSDTSTTSTSASENDSVRRRHGTHSPLYKKKQRSRRNSASRQHRCHRHQVDVAHLIESARRRDDVRHHKKQRYI